MSWIDDARRDRAAFYLAFRGEAGTRQVAWGTHTVHRAGQRPLEARLQMPQSIVRGIPETHAGAIERVSLRLNLDNTDRALDWLMHGGETEVGTFLEDSALTLAGKLYVGLLDTGEEIPITPIICMSAQASQQGRWISLPMASRDDLILGPSRRLITLGDLRNAPAVRDGLQAVHGRQPASLPATEWQKIRGRFNADLSAVIPWAYGRTPIRLTRGTTDTQPITHYLAWIQRSQPPLRIAEWQWTGSDYASPPPESFSLWGRAAPTGLDRLDLVLPGRVWAFPVRVSLEDEDVDVWVVGVTINAGVDGDADVHVIPGPRDRVGLWPGDGVMGGVPDIIRAIVQDHSVLGAAAIHSQTYERARRASSSHGVTGGLVATDAPLWERLSHLAGLGYALWIDTQNRLRMLPAGAWSEEEIAIVEAGVPEIAMHDVVAGTWREWIPSGDARGAAARRISIDWSSDQTSYWPRDMLLRRPAIMRRAKILEETETRISGAWTFPPMVEDALAMVGTLRVWPTRRIECVVSGLWAAALELGDLVRISHPDGVAPGGYHRRLARVERMEIQPAEQGVRLQLEDLGWLDGLRPGVLDSITHWMIYDPRGTGIRISLFAEDGTVKADAEVFTQAMVGAHLRVWGAAHDGNRREYRIVSVDSPTSIQVWPTPAVDEEVEASPLGVDLGRAAWYVCHSRASLGMHYRPWAITLAGEESGQHSDGTPAYRLLGG